MPHVRQRSWRRNQPRMNVRRLAHHGHRSVIARSIILGKVCRGAATATTIRPIAGRDGVLWRLESRAQALRIGHNGSSASLICWSVVRYRLCMCVARHQRLPAAANGVLARQHRRRGRDGAWTTARSATNWCTSSPPRPPARCTPTIRSPRTTLPSWSGRWPTPSPVRC